MDKTSFGDRAADLAKDKIGSWSFIVIFLVLCAVWSDVNIHMGEKALDPFPFILLNLLLSLMAGIQGPLIMISQNRQEKLEGIRAERERQMDELMRTSVASIEATSKAMYELIYVIRDHMIEEEQKKLDGIDRGPD